MCILMKQAGLRDANKPASRSDGGKRTQGASPPRHALICEWNTLLGASEAQDEFKHLCSVTMELVN